MKEILMPLIGSSFPLGEAASFVDSISDSDERTIAKAELAYFQGRPEEAYNLAKPYLESPRIGLRSSACFIVIYASLPLKRMSQAQHGLAILERQMKEAFGNERAAAIFGYQAAYSLLHLHDGANQDAKDMPRINQGSLPASLSEGVKLFAAYVAAHQAYLRGEYEYSLGIASGAISMATTIYPISFLYLYLIQCMCCISLKRSEQARETFAKAWDIAGPDNLIEGIAEHHGLTGGLIESCIKPQNPQAYRDIIAITYRFSKGWRMLHNPTTGEDVADNLSTTEFSIAMLMSKNWSIKEIAAHLGISENTVKTHTKSVYKKLGISSRKELGQFMLR